MRALWLLGIPVTLCVFTCGAHAQSSHGYQFRVDAPDCRLAKKSSDNFIADGTFGTIHARRWQLQSISVGTAIAAAEAVHLVFHASAPKAAFFGGLGVGVLPHVRSQLFQRRYPISLTDDAADIAERMVPFIAIADHADNSWTGKVATALSVAATLLGASCFSSP